MTGTRIGVGPNTKRLVRLRPQRYATSGMHAALELPDPHVSNGGGHIDDH